MRLCDIYCNCRYVLTGGNLKSGLYIPLNILKSKEFIYACMKDEKVLNEINKLFETNITPYTDSSELDHEFKIFFDSENSDFKEFYANIRSNTIGKGTSIKILDINLSKNIKFNIEEQINKYCEIGTMTI